jgi:hypothetical protein
MSDESGMTRERTYQWADPEEIVNAGRTLNGLEFLRSMARGELPMPPFLHTLGVELAGVEVQEGRVSFLLQPREFHYNPIGSVHGGAIAT